MNKEDNLRPVTTTEEAKERGRAGGIASGQAKRKKKLLSEIAEAFLSSKVNEENITEKLKELGFKGQITKKDLLIYDLYTKAMSNNGFAIQAFKELRNLIGEEEPQKMDVVVAAAPTLAEQTERIMKVMEEAKKRAADE